MSSAVVCERGKNQVQIRGWGRGQSLMEDGAYELELQFG